MKSVCMRIIVFIAISILLSPESMAADIDSVAPTPVVTGAAFTSDKTPTWNWTSGGGNGTFRYKLNNNNLASGATETTALSFTPAADRPAGPHTLYLQERDAAGNWSSSGSFTITIDLAKPLGNTVQMLPKTGQKTCYDSAGNITACSGTGQDADIQAGKTWPVPRFNNHGDGTITDELTGLMWLRNAGTPAVTGTPNCAGYTKTWQESLDYISCLNTNKYRGYSDWRLPNINELKSLFHCGVPNPAVWLNDQGFVNVQAGDTAQYRSSTPRNMDYPDISFYNFRINMRYGWVDDGNLTDKDYVWPVRSKSLLPVTGQTFCYDQDYNRTDCTGTGQDGELQSGLAWPDQRFVKSGNCITDRLTGLMWAQNANMPGNAITWQSALAYIKTVNSTGLCGYTDWHLPNLNELGSLINYHEPDSGVWLANQGFANLQSDHYWTSDTYESYNTEEAWGVRVSDGKFHGWLMKNESHMLWPVRMAAGGAWGNTGIAINQGASHTNSTNVRVGLSASDENGVLNMQFRNGTAAWSNPVAYTTVRAWNLSAGDGTKTVSARFIDEAGNLSDIYSDTIILDTVLPVPTAAPAGGAYSSAQDVTLSSNEPSTIYYTTDGSTPGKGSTVFTAPIAISKGTTIKFLAIDKAGNASGIRTARYVIDTAAPLTKASPLTGIYSSVTTVTLNCNDSTGTGCSRTYYTTDGSSPDTLSNIYSAPLAINSTTLLKFFSVDGAGNSEPARTETYIIDSVKPFAGVSSPVNDAALDHLYEISGTAGDSLSGVAEVELQITDGTWYVDANQQLVDTPTWVAASGTDVWSFNTSLVNWANNTVYTIRAHAVDRAGNVSSNVSIIFTKAAVIEQAYTKLSLELSTQTMLQNETISAAGKLTRLPDNGSSLSGKTIKLVITAPDMTVTTLAALTYDIYGHYKYDDISGFTQKGTYTLEAIFEGTPLLAQSTDIKSVLVGASAGYAVIIEGKISSDEGLQSHNKTANRIYTTLMERGFAEENIYYFNYDTVQPGVDDLPSKAGIQYAIETWARFRMNGSPAPLYIIMVNHGNPGVFHIDNETITPADLNAWISGLEAVLNNNALREKRIIIIGSCYSGSFIPALSGSGRVIITSAAADEESYKGPNEPDNIRSGEFFLEEFFKGLETGFSVTESFTEATSKTEAYTGKGGGSANSNNAYHDSSVQHPLLDDDGNGLGSNLLSDGIGDGLVSDELYLGVGLTNSALNPARITDLKGTAYLGASGSSALLWAIAESNSEVDTAWIEVRPPSTTLNSTGGSIQLELNIPREFMTFNSASKRWLKTYTSFTENGKYEIFYFTKRKLTGEISPMRRSVVYKNRAGNNPPAAFNLISPAAGAKQKTVLILDWADAADPDTDQITYTVLISKDSTFTTVDYRLEELSASMAAIGPEAGLKDLQKYYWKVVALDSYGARKSSSQVRSFNTDNTNGTNGLVCGYVNNKTTGKPVKNAKAMMNATLLATTQADGSYCIMTSGGSTLDLVFKASGYRDSAAIQIYVPADLILTRNMELVPINTTITSKPPKTTTSTTAAYSFTSTEAGATFRCRLDSSAYSVCSSPKTYSGLAAGSHTFMVKSVDQTGNMDITPASYTWTISASAPQKADKQ